MIFITFVCISWTNKEVESGDFLCTEKSIDYSSKFDESCNSQLSSGGICQADVCNSSDSQTDRDISNSKFGRRYGLVEVYVYPPQKIPPYAEFPWNVQDVVYIYHRALKRKKVLQVRVVSLIKCEMMGSGMLVVCKVNSSVQSC